MNGSQILSDKFSAEALPEICAPRHAVVGLIQRGSYKRIVYLSAPAGYGKTVSTLLWLRNSGRVPIWIGLDEFDNTLPVFYKLFCTGILSVQPENRAMANIAKSPAFDSSPVEHTIRLLSEFIPDGRRYAVVLDDMHLITNEQIRKSGLLVQKRMPQSSVVLVLTRNVVAQKYIEITGLEKLTVIDSKDLAFSPKEIQRYFVEYGNFITEEEASEIHNITNGWAIGINIMAMSGQIGFNPKGGQILGNYIKLHIWDKWNKDLREFMLKTALVDEMPVELCLVLTGREDSRDILEGLCNENSFVNRSSAGLYKYHNLFCEFLRDQALQSGIDTEEIYRKAANYYIDQGDYFMARRYAAKGGDMETLVEVLHHFAQYKSACLDDFVSFSTLYANEAPPESVCDKAPFLYAMQLWENYLMGNAVKMEYFTDKIYQFLPMITSSFPYYTEAVMIMLTLDHRIPLSAQCERFALLPPNEYLHEGPQGATLTHEMPFLHRGNRDYSEFADKAVREKVKACCGQLLKENIDIFLSGIEAGLLLEKNLIKEAMVAALDTRCLENEHTSDEFHFSVSILLAETCYAIGDPKWNRIMKETEDFIEEKGAHYLRPNFMAYKTRVLLSNADKPVAMNWFKSYFVTESEHLELYRIFQHFTTARAYIVLSETDKAIRYVLKLKKLATDFNRPLDIAEASVLQAVLEWAAGSKKEALETLEKALTAMQEYGYVRVFSDEGAAVLPILKRLVSNQKKGNRPSLVNLHFLNKVTIAAYEQSKQCRGIAIHIRNSKPVKLSKQQKHIITLLSKGYKNAEIVEMTGLTIHTIKSHQAASYTKLGVNSAMDAVLKARELELIE